MRIKLPYMHAVAIFIMVTLCAQSWAANSDPYLTKNTCDGFPKIDVHVKSGLCVGLIDSHLGFARGVAAIGSDIYITDLGGWEKGRGRLLRIGNYGHSTLEVLLDHLDEPNAIIPAPGNALYISVLGKIIRYDPSTHMSTDVVINLPTTGRHALSALALALDGSIFINIGSATDHCERSDGGAPDRTLPCIETLPATMPRASILHVMPQESPVDASKIVPYATGLRNSMALTVLPTGQLYAAVNSRDTIDQADPSLSDEALPHDLLNLMAEGLDYGWPYCYDNNQPSPEYPYYDCTKKQLPTLLLPAHAAPLGMLFYKGNLLPEFNSHLIISYHGYRENGHRIVALALGKNGLPKSKPTEIISGWELKPGNHPQGAPVGLFELEDGSILITEDRNGTLLRLSQVKR